MLLGSSLELQSVVTCSLAQSEEHYVIYPSLNSIKASICMGTCWVLDAALITSFSSQDMPCRKWLQQLIKRAKDAPTGARALALVQHVVGCALFYLASSLQAKLPQLKGCGIVATRAKSRRRAQVAHQTRISGLAIALAVYLAARFLALPLGVCSSFYVFSSLIKACFIISLASQWRSNKLTVGSKWGRERETSTGSRETSKRASELAELRG